MGRRPLCQAPIIDRGPRRSTVSGHVNGGVDLETAVREGGEILDAVVDAPQYVLLVQEYDRRIFTEVFDSLLDDFATRFDVGFIDSGVGQFVEPGVRMLIVGVGRMPD